MKIFIKKLTKLKIITNQIRIQGIAWPARETRHEWKKNKKNLMSLNNCLFHFNLSKLKMPTSKKLFSSSRKKKTSTTKKTGEPKKLIKLNKILPTSRTRIKLKKILPITIKLNNFSETLKILNNRL
jgi:septin family protein